MSPFMVDIAQRVQEKVAQLRDLGQGSSDQQKTLLRGKHLHGNLHGQGKHPGASLDIVAPDALTSLAMQKDSTGHAHMVKVSMNGFDVPPGTVPRVRDLRHGARMNGKGQWEVQIDPDQFIHPHLSTERSLQQPHWWDHIHVPMSAGEVGQFFHSVIQSGVDAGEAVGRAFWFNIQDLNQHLTMGWDQTVSGLNRWVHILWRALVIGAIVYGVVLAAPLLGILSQFLSFLWETVLSVVFEAGDVVSWLLTTVETMVESIVSIFQ